MSDKQRTSFSDREKEVLAMWEQKDIFNKSLKKDAPKGNFVFFEGPPTANGMPGIHHAESRAFKDCIPRFRTMQGYQVDRKGGWDTHGLPVELEVEKRLGFTGKADIEEYGIAKFNEECKKSVWKYLDQWQEFTKRLGFWVDLEKAYVTYYPEYVESLWWVIKQVWDKELLYQDYRVTPHCPRCETSLSSHELSQGYQEVEDPAVYVKFKVTKAIDGSVPENEYLVAWTTTPWTLPANVALAVGEQIVYVKVKKGEEFLWLAQSRVEEATQGDYEIVEERAGSELVGMEYEPLYPFIKDAISNPPLTPPLKGGGTHDNSSQKEAISHVPSSSQGGVGEGSETSPLSKGGLEGGSDKLRAWYVVPADFVSTEDGSGIVHTAVMYGADDFELGTKLGLPKYHLVGLNGHFTDQAGFLSGKFVKGADPLVIKDLIERGLMLLEGKVKHSYPFCWRCKSPVIYYAKDSWYIRMSSLRDQLLAENEKINWEPSHIKDGRFGEWLREVKDWAFSRERYWGTPLPIWVCEECGEKTCVGSFEELKEKTTSSNSFDSSDPSDSSNSFDPHRPYVDEIEIKCDKCNGVSKRVPDVCDVWFDSGCMPYAQWHYPFENKGRIDENVSYPADYISEAIDQTRGWFYTLLAVSTLLGKEQPYKNVVCLGHVLDVKGKKMSKSVGNIVEPLEMMDKYGADAVRWYMYALNQPGESKKFDEKLLAEMVRKNFTILMNVLSFYQMYAVGAAPGGRPVGSEHNSNGQPPGVVPTHILDVWIMSRLNQLIKENTEYLENYKITEPVRNISNFINDLSTWYLRRSRDRFKGGSTSPSPFSKGELGGGSDKQAALMTLQTVLLELSKLMAPFTPFLAEDLYSQVKGSEESVHLDSWPVASAIGGHASGGDQNVLDQMAQTRSIVSKALEARVEAGKNVRQVLAGMKVTLPSGELGAEYVEVLKDEVNVKEVSIEKGEYAVELDIALTPELVREGTVREIIRRINSMRKKAGLSIEDRIELYIQSSEEEVQKAIAEHSETLLNGTLSEKLQTQKAPDNVEAFRVNEFEMELGFISRTHTLSS
ncbi:isoleucine--tRNA ligase, partial [Patescibacteria group bacterium]